MNKTIAEANKAELQRHTNRMQTLLMEFTLEELHGGLW